MFLNFETTKKGFDLKKNFWGGCVPFCNKKLAKPFRPIFESPPLFLFFSESLFMADGVRLFLEAPPSLSSSLGQKFRTSQSAAAAGKNSTSNRSRVQRGIFSPTARFDFSRDFFFILPFRSSQIAFSFRPEDFRIAQSEQFFFIPENAFLPKDAQSHFLILALCVRMYTVHVVR